MFDRILFSTLAAASLAAAAPALAGDDAAAEREVSRCCERVAMLMQDNAEEERAKAQQPATPTPERASPIEEEDPYVRNQSWGG